MKRHHLHLGGIFAAICLLAACSPQRPVIFEDPRFSDAKIFDEGTGFLLPARVDVKPMLQDFVTAFDGKPGRGEHFLLEKLGAFLSGEKPINYPGDSRFISSTRCKFREFSSLVDTTGLGGFLTFATDSDGLLQMEILDPEGLAGLMQEAELEHLMLLRGLKAGRETKPRKEFPRETYIGDDSTLTAQMFIWSSQSRALLWQGYVVGVGDIYVNFTHDTAEEMARELASDIYDVLN